MVNHYETTIWEIFFWKTTLCKSDYGKTKPTQPKQRLKTEIPELNSLRCLFLRVLTQFQVILWVILIETNTTSESSPETAIKWAMGGVTDLEVPEEPEHLGTVAGYVGEGFKQKEEA